MRCGGMKRTRSDWMAKIAEALTGEPLQRRQSENVIDRRSEPKGPKMAMPGRRNKHVTLTAQEQADLIGRFRKRASEHHKRVWGSNQ